MQQGGTDRPREWQTQVILNYKERGESQTLVDLMGTVPKCGAISRAVMNGTWKDWAAPTEPGRGCASLPPSFPTRSLGLVSLKHSECGNSVENEVGTAFFFFCPNPA